MKKNYDVSLLWPHKNYIFEFRQESPDKKPEKIFYDKEKDSEEINKLLAPKVFTNFKRVDKDGERPAEEIKPTDNLIIKGENLVAMHTLKERYDKKPEELLRILIALVTKEGDLVMDFFAGTGTTCAAAHKMNRQYIGIEILDYGKNGPVARLKNVINGDKTGISKKVGWQGGGSFVYCELLKRNGKYINRNEATAEERKKDLLCSEVL